MQIYGLIIVVLVGAFLPVKKVSAQLEGANWCFRDSVGIKFMQNGEKEVFKSNGISIEANAAISDSMGNLLMYLSASKMVISSSAKVGLLYKSNHALFANGFGLNYEWTAINGALILPNPELKNIYYIITVGINWKNMYVHTVDLLAEGGNGMVIEKNKLLIEAEMTEKLGAVRQSNGKDWWVYAHERNSNRFYRLKVTRSGVEVEGEQKIGSSHFFLTTTLESSGSGELCISQDGQHLAVVSQAGLIELFKMDRCTGELKYWATPSKPDNEIVHYGYIGCSFSPNGHYLYINKMDSLFQYSVFDNFSRTLIASLESRVPKSAYQYWGNELGLDGKMYN